MNTHIKRKNALITGASRGLGLALARALAERGWNLIIDARKADALETVRQELENFTQVITIPGDISDVSHQNKLALAAESLGGLNVLINNAGILGPSPQPALLDYPLNELERVFRINLFAQLAVIQVMRPYFVPDAKVINVTSDAGVEAYGGWGGYGSSKAALEQISNILAVENPKWRVYSVDPGDIRTQMHQLAFPGEDISDRPLPSVSVPGFLALLENDFPSGRYQAQNILERS